jgi:hypothetical protein
LTKQRAAAGAQVDKGGRRFEHAAEPAAAAVPPPQRYVTASP